MALELSTVSGPPELSQRRRQAVLAICCMSLLLVAIDNTIVNVALPTIRARPARLAVGAAVDGGRLHDRAREPVAARRLHRRSTRAQAHLSGGAADLLRRLAAVQPRTRARLADRRAHAAGGRRLDAQPSGDVDHHQRVHRPPRARARDRRVGRGCRASAWHSVRCLGGAAHRAVGWRSIFWINVPIGLAAFALTARYVPGIARRASATRRPGGPGARDPYPRLAHLRGDRGAAGRVVLGADRGLLCAVGDRVDVAAAL